jgi:hypothetical protein
MDNTNTDHLHRDENAADLDMINSGVPFVNFTSNSQFLYETF